jgi:hypothetical protein
MNTFTVVATFPATPDVDVSVHMCVDAELEPDQWLEAARRTGIFNESVRLSINTSIKTQTVATGAEASSMDRAIEEISNMIEGRCEEIAEAIQRTDEIINPHSKWL